MAYSNDELSRLLELALATINAQMVRLEALRSVLVQHGVVDQQEYVTAWETRWAEIQPKLEAKLRAVEAADQDRQLREFLALFDGDPQ